LQDSGVKILKTTTPKTSMTTIDVPTIHHRVDKRETGGGK
jgi:hypothetical protein